MKIDAERGSQGGERVILGAMTERILVVDDEKPLAQMVASYLDRAGFDTDQAHTGPTAVELARSCDPDVVILDLGLPELDGLEVCRRIREFSDCYILMLTARGAEDDRITGLALGADDYITKPFSVRDLVTRVHAVLRRPRPTAQRSYTFGDLEIDPAARIVTVGGEEVDVTRTEFDLLAALASRPGEVLDRRELVTEVWDTTWVGDERIVDVHIGNLRRKVGAGHIATVRGVGYRMGKE